MKRRAEFDWSEVPYPETMTGTTEAIPAPSSTDHPAGVLWVPDPEQRYGWREVYVQKSSAKPDRPCGFQKPGAR